jgi:hypothetical protein
MTCRRQLHVSPMCRNRRGFSTCSRNTSKLSTCRRDASPTPDFFDILPKTVSKMEIVQAERQAGCGRRRRIYRVRDEENHSRPGMAETPDASRAQSAALYVGGARPAGAVEHADPAEIDRQAHRLTGWARANGAVIPADDRFIHSPKTDRCRLIWWWPQVAF